VGESCPVAGSVDPGRFFGKPEGLNDRTGQANRYGSPVALPVLQATDADHPALAMDVERIVPFSRTQVRLAREILFVYVIQTDKSRLVAVMLAIRHTWGEKRHTLRSGQIGI